MARAVVIAALVASVPALAGCGPAVDASYPGEPLFLVRGNLRALTQHSGVIDDPELARTLRLAVIWSAPNADSTGSIDDTPITAGTATDFTVGVFEEPSPSTWRTLATGAVALGELAVYGDRDGDARLDPDEVIYGASTTLVAFSPDGAADPWLAAPLAPGFHLLLPSGPCNVAPTRLFAPPSDTVGIYVGLAYDVASMYFAPGCVAAAARTSTCAPLATIRYLCRYGPRPAELCAECEYLLFPWGAEPAVCDAWRDRCVLGNYGQDECASERTVCLAGEPAPVTACDLPCACEAYVAWCLDETGSEDGCAAKGAACDWLAPDGG